MLSIIGPPTTDLEVGRTFSIINMVHSWQQGKALLVVPATFLGFVVVVLADQGPVGSFSRIGIFTNTCQNGCMNSYSVGLPNCCGIPSIARCHEVRMEAFPSAFSI